MCSSVFGFDGVPEPGLVDRVPCICRDLLLHDNHSVSAFPPPRRGLLDQPCPSCHRWKTGPWSLSREPGSETCIEFRRLKLHHKSTALGAASAEPQGWKGGGGPLDLAARTSRNHPRHQDGKVCLASSTSIVAHKPPGAAAASGELRFLFPRSSRIW